MLEVFIIVFSTIILYHIRMIPGANLPKTRFIWYTQKASKYLYLLYLYNILCGLHNIETRHYKVLLKR